MCQAEHGPGMGPRETTPRGEVAALARRGIMPNGEPFATLALRFGFGR